jgi:hypothetical protein
MHPGNMHELSIVQLLGMLLALERRAAAAGGG